MSTVGATNKVNPTVMCNTSMIFFTGTIDDYSEVAAIFNEKMTDVDGGSNE